MEPDNKAGGSMLERAAAFAPRGPTMNQLISLAGAVHALKRAHGWSEHAAARFLVSELQEAAYDLPLYWLLRGGEVMRLPDVRVPMEPEAIPTAWACSRHYYLSERDHLLSSLSMAIAGNHMIGDPEHEASRRAAFLHLVIADFDRWFIAPLPVPEREREVGAMPPAPIPAAPSKPPAASPLKWTDEHLQTLVNAVDTERRQGGERGSIGRVLKKWDKLFPARPKVSRTALLAALKRADDKGIGPESAATWLSPMRKPKSTTPAAAHRPGRVHKLGD